MRSLSNLDPINKVAHRVTQQGVSKPLLKEHTRRKWENVPPLRDEKYYKQAGKNPGWVDLRGRKHGKMVVIGVWDGTTNHLARWVVRCQCGMYELRRARAIKDVEKNLEDKCEACRQLEMIQTRASRIHQPRRNPLEFKGNQENLTKKV